jgi:hypothetical protein
MIVLKLLSDRDILKFDHNRICVNMLLNKGTFAWGNVSDISTRTFSRWDVKALFVNGTRHVIVINGVNVEGSSRDLMIPIDLLDLDKERLTNLIADLLHCRAAADAITPLRQTRRQNQAAYMFSPASDPRESFDPDAIIARHLAERTRLIEQDSAQREAMRPRQPAPFGRKRAA